jgi:hypothetical protein
VDRAIPDSGFAGDDGSADAALAEALAAYAAGRTGERAVLAAMPEARLLVAVLAVPAHHIGAAGDHRVREGGTDMALATVTGSDGRRALPAFTSVDALAAWNPDARPVPATTQRVCLAALTEAADLVVVDPAGPVTYLLEGAALRALAAGREPVPPLRDPDVAAAVRAAASSEPLLAAAYLLPTAAADFVLGLVLSPEISVADDASVIQRIAGRVAQALADDPILRERLDRGMDLAVLPAGTTPTGGQVLFARPDSSGGPPAASRECC